ncbi:siderophore ABC transporter substrate-binding protein [Paenibacillus albicereus]|uniref:Siderophore ABC transporter substrate-binding protein n=1 Tax=Paenibacillus albicereus TaxID=2726185 RepID=A0A6H2GS16_9BACL|nr:siderophore ABC transporter substrate-binding protein [Paenibacillus albicereus]QJC50202.1 siderophore ABC transporter substrate-binding protein [Paenibacillus albicereus]
MNKAKWLSLSLILMLTLALSACGASNNGNAGANEGGAAASNAAVNAAANAGSEAAPSGEVTLKHKLGEATVTANPQKVVVFDFGALDTLDALGLEANVAGVPAKNLPPYLEKYSSKENVGGLKEPDFEKVNSIKPDLIIISGRQQDSYEEFAKIAPTLFVELDQSNYFESFSSNVNTLAGLFGKEADAQAKLDDIQAAVGSASAKAGESGKKGLIVLTAGGKMSAYGVGSRFGIIHDALGVEAVDPSLKVETHGQSVTSEFIAEKNPGYLFVIDRDAALGEGDNAKGVIDNELVNKTDAAKDGKIVYLSPQYWYLSGGGLISVAEMVKEVEAAL